MATTYDIGDRPVVTATFRDTTDVLTDPTTVTFITRNPAGTETAVTAPNAAIVNSSVGVWVFTFPTPIDTDGAWYVRAKGTAGIVAAGELSFTVRRSHFTAP